MKFGTRSRRLSAMTLALAFLTAVLVPVLSFAESPDVGNTPETAKPVAASYSTTGSIEPGVDDDDVYKVWLTAGKRFEARTNGGTAGVDVDLFMSSATATDTLLRYSAHDGSYESITYDVRKSGWYFVDVWAYDGSEEGFPTPSAAGDYYMKFRQIVVPYKLVYFTVPTTAKKYTYFTVSVKTSPTYVRTGKPVTFAVQKKTSSGYVTKYKYTVSGVNVTGNMTKFKARLKLGRGTWRVQARFKDIDHPLKTTVWKYVKVS